MDNEEIVQQDIQEDIPEIAEPENEVQDELLEQLRGEIVQLKIKLALLVGGAASAKLDEGIKLAEGILTADGVTPEEAAAEVLEEYPHIKLESRSVPRISAESGGRGDGFAAIRGIFARR